jgi:hypothetical protein
MVRCCLKRFDLRAYRSSERTRQAVGLCHRRVIGREEIEVVSRTMPEHEADEHAAASEKEPAVALSERPHEVSLQSTETIGLHQPSLS